MFGGQGIKWLAPLSQNALAKAIYGNMAARQSGQRTYLLVFKTDFSEKL